MPSKIDWLSISLPYSSVVSTDFATGKPKVRQGIVDELPHIGNWINSFDDFKLGKGRKIFSHSAHSSIGGFTVYWNPTRQFSLVEFTGTGCMMLRRHELLSKFINLYKEYFTRIDIATDIECDTRPVHFVEYLQQNRFKSSCIIESTTGETYYVGSQKSDRFCRVYRYAPPHPRSNLLRVEFVLRDNDAKMFGASLQQSRLSSLVSALGNTFGFSHPSWMEKRSDAPLASYPRETGQGKTERWLLTQVLPAIEKLLENGGDAAVAHFGKRVYDLYNERQTKKEYHDGKETILPYLEFLREQNL